MIDDDAKLQESLRWLLESGGFVVHTFASADAFLATHDGCRPGCVLIDLRLPGTDGLTLQARLVANRADHLAVIFLTAYGDIDSAVQAMKLGAVDFFQKPYVAERLLEQVGVALDKVRQQARATSPQVRARLRQLTDRERQVLEHVVAGKSNKEIASLLGVSYRTIENHRARAIRKMGAESIVELVRMMLDTRRPNSA